MPTSSTRFYASVCLTLILFSYSTARSTSFRTNFKTCCSIGKEHSNSTNSCTDYSKLDDKSGSCKFAFTICCNQKKRVNECERGKKHALASLPCSDLKNDNCDILSDCCNCCDLGIQTRNSGEECIPAPELSTECNNLFLECCKLPSLTDVCNTHFCPNGQVCENTRTGPVCKCPLGYERDKSSNYCIDIDECKQPNICERGSTCQNTAGSYACKRSCGSGYTYDAIFITCRDVNECTRGKHDCAIGMRCENFPGTYRCIREKPCGTGYSVNAFTQECDDIDECSQSIHDCAKGFNCLNVPGTFKCIAKECGRGHIFNYNTGECEQIICTIGFQLDHNDRCSDIDECKLANTCHSNERCENTVGSYECIFVLICEEGYVLNESKTECIDTDECENGRHTCPLQATCVNTPGSFKCMCPSGYKLDENRNICEDIDECAFGKVCPANSHCRNTPGSFICDCKQGFTQSSHIFHSCTDDNECTRTGICDHKCVNTFGSYQCACREGYKLSTDKRTCVDIDECELQPLICPGVCRNTPGSYECSCSQGFQMDYRRSCQDLDECELKTHNCGARDVCVNTRGNFKCIKIDCPEGYSLIGDSKNSRCDRAPAVCKFGEMECLKKPMKIFYSHTSFSYLVQVPIRLFTTRVNVYSRRIKIKHEFKLVGTDGNHLREDQFMVKQTDSNTFDIYLLEACRAAETFQLELKIELYNENQFSSCLLNKIYVYVTD